MKRKELIKLMAVISLIYMLTIYQRASVNLSNSDNTTGNFNQTKNHSNIHTSTINSTLKIKLEFVGFNENLIDEPAIRVKLYKIFIRIPFSPISATQIHFEFNFFSEENRLILENYSREKAINGTGTGYKIDKELLQQDLISGNRSNIFLPMDGMSIDAELINEFIYENFYEEPAINEPGYTLYLMNFSNFDSPDHSLEHWYDTYGADLDTNETPSWWYSGYSNLPKRAAVGWGGKYRFCYLDLSARSWYIDFVKIAWQNMVGGTTALYYTYPDLDSLAQIFDFETPEGKNKLTQYIVDWINSYSGNVFSRPLMTSTPIKQSVSLQVKIFNNLTLNGYPLEDLQWCISDTKILYQLEHDLPWINWDVKIEWVLLNDYPILFDYIQANIENDVNGRYIEVSSGLYSLLQSQLNEHFNSNAAEVVLPCYFFITDAISFKWGGTSFAGLGGMGWEILLGTQYSLFENGVIGQSRRGMSDVMIHELGHSLGLPHPHSAAYGWGSSYVDDTMSYFPISSGFSQFNIDSIGSAHTEANFFYAKDEYNTALQLYNDTGKPEELLKTLEQINIILLEIPQYYQQMDYITSALKAFEVRELIAYAIDYLNYSSTKTASNLTNYSLIIVGIIFPIINFVIKLFSRKKNTK